MSKNLILASLSPRRRNLMRRMGLSFDTYVSDAEQKELSITEPAEYALEQARFKARDAAKIHSGIIVASDTVVAIDDMILGKPEHEQDAKRMLKRLSGRTHTVFTSLVVLEGSRELSCVSSTHVEFAAMTDLEIDYYVSTQEPMDKAGAYGIQDIGMRYIKGISGDYYTVCGLPVRKLYEFLTEIGYF